MQIENPVLRLFALIGTFLLPAFFVIYLNSDAPIFWDLAAYERAISDYNVGTNPYEVRRELNFVYPPFFMKLISPLGGFLKNAFLLIYILTLFAILHKNMRIIGVGLLLCVGMAHLTIVRSVLSGNLTLFLHIAIIFAWVTWPRKPLAFCLVLIFAAALKPYFLAYLTLPLMSFPFSKNLFKPVFFVTIMTILSYALQAWLYPVEFDNFLAALTAQTGYLNQGLADTDLGDGLYVLFLAATDSKFLAISLHIAVVMALLVVNLRLAHRQDPDVPKEVTTFLLPVMIACMANPRLKVYDDPIMTASAAAVIIMLCHHFSQRLVASGAVAIFMLNFLMFIAMVIEVPDINTRFVASLRMLGPFAFVLMAMLMVIAMLNRNGDQPAMSPV